MPIYRILREGKVPQDQFERLNRAFALTLDALRLVDRLDPICDIVARKVIEIDAAGMYEPEKIAKRAAMEVGVPRLD